MFEFVGKDELVNQVFGAKAVSMHLLNVLGIPIPKTYFIDNIIPMEVDAGLMIEEVLKAFGNQNLLAIRPSFELRILRELPTFLNLGIADDPKKLFIKRLGKLNFYKGYCGLIQKFSTEIFDVDPDNFDNLYLKIISSFDKGQPSSAEEDCFRDLLEEYKLLFKKINGKPFPQTLKEQLSLVLRFLRRKSLRLASYHQVDLKDLKMGLVVQEMANGADPNYCHGNLNFFDKQSGKKITTGSIYEGIPQDISEGSFGRKSKRILINENMSDAASHKNLINQEQIDYLFSFNEILGKKLKDTFEIDFSLNGSDLTVLNFRISEKSIKAAVQLAVDMAAKEFITKREALMKVDPLALTEYLHPQIKETEDLSIICKAVSASPGAATGKIVFTSNLALNLSSRGESVILVMNETGPEDVKGMKISKGVLTVRGGLTSHAALIARGLGIPCVVGAIDLRINLSEKILYLKNGEKFSEGDEITINGTNGDIIKGKCQTKAPELTGAFSDLLTWADEYRSLKVRANADTPQDAALARKFNVDGIGLCRTEHMFFKKERLFLMQEMIFAEDKDQRKLSLEKLLPIQRKDFIDLFEVMSGQPVAIRLLDPPLHEFLPKDREQLAILAEKIGVEYSYISRRSRELMEFNPMLGHRGVRLGITMPEIYQMQVRAIFEATSNVLKAGTGFVTPEIMLPLVSANKEVEVLRKMIQEIADEVYEDNEVDFSFKIGAMIETPRAALRAGDVAAETDFISFGTNDLTQMTYGLSRDDAGKFLNDYIGAGVFKEDPFLSLDQVGVGELISLACDRGKKANKKLSIALCGEHGGDPSSIFYCKALGLDYVSCSPYRVPIARLAAAQADIKEEDSLNGV